MKTVCIIPARGGSVRIPGKNIKPFHGKPIMLYSIETAQRSMLFDEIIVSTDDAEISRIARKAGASVFWRKGTDDGTKGTQEVAADVLREKPAGLACVLYATAPLLLASDIVSGYRALHKWTTPFVFSVDRNMNDVGGFYWGYGSAFAEGVPLDGPGCALRVELPDERCCDINDQADWDRAERLFHESARPHALRRATP